MPNHPTQTSAGALPSWPLFAWVPLFWCGAAGVGRSEVAPAAGASSATAGTWIKGMAQASCEMSTLFARRAQAWQSASIELCRARTPSEAAAVHAQFWQGAVSDQQQALRGIMNAWLAAAPMPRAPAAPVVRDRLDLDAGRTAAEKPVVERCPDGAQRTAA